MSLTKAKRLLEQLYNRHGAGCCLHIVTDDGNIEDTHVDFCIKYAEKNHCGFCKEFGQVLKDLGELGRAHLLNMRWCPKHQYTLYEQCGIDNCLEVTEPLRPLIPDPVNVEAKCREGHTFMTDADGIGMCWCGARRAPELVQSEES